MRRMGYGNSAVHVHDSGLRDFLRNLQSTSRAKVEKQEKDGNKTEVLWRVLTDPITQEVRVQTPQNRQRATFDFNNDILSDGGVSRYKPLTVIKHYLNEETEISWVNHNL